MSDTIEQRTESLKKILESNPVGQSLLPILRCFDVLNLEPDLYQSIAECLFLAYKAGMKATTQDLLSAGKAVNQ